MASKLYYNPETAIVWKASGGDKTLTLTSLTDQHARVGAQWDRGAGALPGLYMYHFIGKGSSTLVIGRSIRLYGAGSRNGTDIPGRVGTADASITSGVGNRLLNVPQIGSIFADSTSSSDALIKNEPFMIWTRYWSPVVWNDLSVALSGTAGDFELAVEPYVPEFQ